MNLIKGLTKYIFILFLIFLGVCVIASAIMFISPSTKIFGYSYYSINTTQRVACTVNPDNTSPNAKYIGNATDITTINIYSGTSGVEILSNDISPQYCTVEGEFHGAGLWKHKSSDADKKDLYKIKVEKVDTNTLNISIETIDGIFSYSQNKVCIYLPTENGYKYTNLTNINIETTSGDVNVANRQNDNLPLEQSTILNIKTSNGNSSITHLSLKELNISTNSGKVNVNDLAYPAIDGVKIDNKKGEITFEDTLVISKYCNINSEVSKINLGTVYNLTYNGDSAYLNINEAIGTISINSPNATVKINKAINGDTNAVLGIPATETSIACGYDATRTLYKTGIRNYTINELSVKNVFLETANGKIVINKLITKDDAVTDKTANGSITSKSGNITIKELVGNIYASTTSGTIDISQSTSNQNDIIVNNSVIKLESETGSIKAKNIVGFLNVSTSNKSSIYVDVASISVNSNTNRINIAGKKGDIEVNLPKPNSTNVSYYVINIATESGDILGELSSNSMPLKNGYFYIDCSAAENPDEESAIYRKEFSILPQFADAPFINVSSSSGDLTFVKK